MIAPDARLSIQKLSIAQLQCKAYETRYVDRLLHYIQLMRDHPDEYAGLLHVVPSDTHPGMYAILEGHHRLCASIMVGREDALCVVVEEGAKQ